MVGFAVTCYQQALSQMTTAQIELVKGAIQDAALADALNGNWKTTLLHAQKSPLATLKVKRLLVALASIENDRKQSAIDAFMSVMPRNNHAKNKVMRAL